MNKPLSVGEYVRSVFSGTRAATFAFALSLMGCIGPQSPQEQPTKSPLLSEQVEEKDTTDIDNPIFIALTGISREIQAGSSNPNESSLQFMWEYTSKRLKEMNIQENVSVRLICPFHIDGQYPYAEIEAVGQKAYISADDEKTAIARTRAAQEFYMKYMEEKIEMSLGRTPANRAELMKILVNEEGILSKHRMKVEIESTKDNSLSVSFVADAL